MAMERKAVLADGLLKLGIGRSVDAIMTDFFNKNSDKDEPLSEIEFTEKVLVELELSLKVLWLSQSNLLRDIAKTLPASSNFERKKNFERRNQDPRRRRSRWGAQAGGRRHRKTRQRRHGHGHKRLTHSDRKATCRA